MFRSRPIFRTVFRNAFRFNSSKAPPKPTGLKALMKEYGYSAFAIYMGLSAIDLPLCYVLVHSMGREEIEHYENEVKRWFGYGMSEEELSKQQEIKRIEERIDNATAPATTSDGSWWATLASQFSWTEFALAYGIHKSLIFIRLPLCAAITPGIVKALRRWGFHIGTDKLARTASIARDHISAANPVAGGAKVSKKSKWFSWFF